MDKQSTLAFVLIGVILVVWLWLNAPEPQPPQEKGQITNLADSLNSLETNNEAKEIETLKEPLIEEEPAEITEGAFAHSTEPEKIITVETDLVRLELTNRGARIKKYFVKSYDTWYNADLPEDAPWYKRWVQLVNKKDGGELDMVFMTKEGQLVNTSKIDFKRNGQEYHYILADNDSLTITYVYDVDGKSKIKKHYTFFGNDYSSKVDIELVNMDKIATGITYDLIWKNGINFVEKNSVDEATFANASVFMGEEQVVIDAPGDGEIEKKDMNGQFDWIGVRNMYFAMILAPEKKYNDGGVYIEGHKTKAQNGDEREFYNIQMKIPFNNKAAQKDSFRMYFGPMDYDILKSYGNNYDAFYDFGSFFGMKFITRPISEFILLPLFKFLHKFIPNYGFVIIVFSIILKLALYPLTKKSYQSMKRMQQLQPKIAELKEQFKSDPQRLQKETMGLYSKYGVNPMGGCLPMVLQMPILFALFTFFKVAIELRHEPFILWIDNLSSPDVLFSLPFSLPLLGTDISGLALLLGISMFLQQKQTVKDPSQKAMVYMMPVMMTVMFNSFASGLNLYYSMFNLLTIAQQSFINKSKKDGELVPVKDPKKKKGGGMMQRMMEAAEAKQKQGQAVQKKKRKF